MDLTDSFIYFWTFTLVILLIILVKMKINKKNANKQPENPKNLNSKKIMDYFLSKNFKIDTQTQQQFEEGLEYHYDVLYFNKKFLAKNPGANGKTCIIKGLPAIQLTEPQIAKQFLDCPYFSKKDANQYRHITILAKGLQFAEGDEWKYKKLIYKNVFSPERVYCNIDKIESLCDKEFSIPNIQASDVLPKFEKITEGLILYQFLGNSYQTVKIFDVSIGKAIEMIQEEISQNEILAIRQGKIQNNKVPDKICNLYHILEQLILKEFLNPLYDKNTMLHLLYEEKNIEFQRQEDVKKLAEDLVLFYVIGKEQTSVLMYMVLYYIVKEKNIYDEVKKEISKFYFQPNGLKQMQYIDSVIAETLRVYGPTVGICFRKVTESHELSGINIEENTIVGVGVPELHHNPNVFEDPFLFKPERFFSGKNKQENDLFSFSQGPRQCLGKNLVLLFTKSVIVHLLSNYQISLPLDYKLRLTFRNLYQPRTEIPFQFQFVDVTNDKKNQ